MPDAGGQSIGALAGNRIGLKPDPQGLDVSPPCGQGESLAGNRVGLKPDPQGLDASFPCGQGESLAGNRARPVWDNSRPMRDHDPMRRAPLPRVACVLGTRPEAVKMAPVI